jgi:hypothetical protein
MHFQRLNSPPTVRLDQTANCLGCTAQAVKFSGRSTPVPAILIHRRRKISPQVPKHSYHYVSFVVLPHPTFHSYSSIYQPLHLSTAHLSVLNVKSCSVHGDHLHLLSVHRYGKPGSQAAPRQCFGLVYVCSQANRSSYSFNSSHLT